MEDLLSAPAPKQHWTSSQVKALLQARYGGGQQCAVLFEVRNSTGFDANRSIDAVTMTLWPSLGLELTGMEIKISRSDWLRELKDPAKASSTFEYFDRWYLIAPRHVAKIDEIPGPWGWIVPEDDKLVTLKKAPLNESVRAIDRKFLASLLRCESKSDEKLIEAAVSRAVEVERKRLRELHDNNIEAEVARRLGAVGADAEKFKKLREALGDKLGWMDDAEMLAAIRAVLTAGVHGTWNGLRRLHQTVLEQATSLETAIKDMGGNCDAGHES